MNEDQTPKKPIVYYYGVALILLLILNILIVPFFEEQKIEKVDYGTFLNMIEDGVINQVNLTDSKITFTSEKEADIIYETGRIDDPNIVDRLYEADVEFTQEIKQEASP